MSYEPLEQPLDALTERELDILNGMAVGLTNKDIAAQYDISVATVRWHTKKIYSKLGVHNRTQASIFARDKGLLEDAAASPATESTIAHNLPHYPSVFVGRANELADIKALLQDPAVRLVSLVGPGGIGKTRLAVEIGRQLTPTFADGVRFVALGPTTTTDEAFMATLRRVLHDTEADVLPEDTLLYLRDKSMLLIFDNFEQSRAQSELVLALLEATTQVKVLITSQVSLNLRQEWVRRLQGLLDPEQQDLTDATNLFNERVRQVRADFDPAANRDCIIEICEAVQGLPLAIELAAAWLKTVSCADVLTELRTNPELLATAAPDAENRHRSLEALFEHTWNLLSEDKRRIFKRLSVFQGEFGFAAAKQVAGASLQTLSALVDWSLVHQTHNNLYQMHTLLRYYAEKKLKAGQHGHQSHLAFALVSLISGDFGEIEKMANQFLKDSSDELNLDKGFAIAILAVIAGANEDYERCLQLGESSTRLTADNAVAALFSYLGLGIGYCGIGDYATAWTVIKQALEAAQTLQSVAFINLCLPVIAVIRATDNQFKDALGIVGLLEHHTVRLPTWMTAWTLYRQVRSEVERQYTPAELHDLWEQSKALDSQAVCQQLLSGAAVW
jgi:predicted ATPase/DNA-binding CsgD family transcriptional regulator